jgi:hypothetical protein
MPNSIWRSGIDVVEVPDLGTVRKHLAAAQVHIHVCRCRGADLSKRHQGQLDMALRWLRQLEGELKDEEFFGRTGGADDDRLRLYADGD